MLFKCPQCGKVIDMTLEELALSKKVVVCPQCLNEFLAKDVDIPASMLRTNIATQSAHKQLYCHSCGESLPVAGLKFCPYCGTEYGPEERPAGDSEKPGCQPKKPGKIKEHRINTYGMIWHRIVLFFVGIKAARSLLSGAAILRNYVDLDVSGFLVAVRNLFLGIGVVRIAIGVFALICLYRLGKYMRSGPGSVKILYGMSIASALIFSTWLTSILPNADTTSMGLYDTLLFDIVMIIVNSVYYGRRKDVFIN